MQTYRVIICINYTMVVTLRIPCLIEIANQKVEIENINEAICIEVRSLIKLQITLRTVERLNEQIEVKHIHRVVVVGIPRLQGGIHTGDISIGSVHSNDFCQ